MYYNQNNQNVEEKCEIIIDEKKTISDVEECIGTMENKDNYFEEEELNYYKNNQKITKICKKPIEKVR